MKPAYWYWNNVFSLKEIKEINKIIDKNKRTVVEDHASDNATKTSTIEQVEYKFLKDYPMHMLQISIILDSVCILHLI